MDPPFKPLDACKLLTPADIEKIQGSAPVAKRASSNDDGNLTSSQCFFSLSPFSQSISLDVMQQAAGDKVNVRDFWKEKFSGQDDTSDVEHDSAGKRRTGREKEERRPSRRVPGVGEAAYWIYSGHDGAIYALQGSYLLRVGVGGTGDEQAKMQRASELAHAALRQLPR
ncbi:MAG: hypothetical protein JOY93_02445 [Acidobacteriales bacterium]|nr:hypothetical protein [Terriglobales bacterium]